jgi:ORF6N domain
LEGVLTLRVYGPSRLCKVIQPSSNELHPRYAAKPMNESRVSVPVERIEKAIYLIRGEKVMLDRDLARLYEVPTKALKQAVRRNIDRFPDDFMFVLDRTEFETWRSQFVTSKADQKGLRHPPMAFTEQGVAMLSSVLNSARAVQVNIAIMRTFVRLRKMLIADADLGRKLAEMEQKYDHQFKVVFDAIRQLMIPTEPKRKQIGFAKAKKK